MKILKYIMAAAVAGTFTLAGCDDFLDAENKSAGGTTADDFFAGNPASMLTSAYKSMKSFNNTIHLGDEGTDLYITIRKTTTKYNQYAFDFTDSDIRSYYANCYSTINYANGALHYGVSDAQAQEARVIRAYAYYCLTQHFGGVPYITDYINTAERNYPRTPLAEVYDNLTADLEDIYNNCQLAAEDHKSGRPSKEAVAALLAKIYLAWGWDIDTQLDDAATGAYTVNENAHFNAAADWATKAINGKALTQPFAQKWAPETENEGNPEFVWVINYDANAIENTLKDDSNGQGGQYGGYYSDFVNATSSSEDQQSVKSLGLFEQGDERYEGTFMTTFYADAADAQNSYYVFYGKSEAELASLPINLKFFPYWVTETEVQDWINANIGRLANLKAGRKNVVAILGNDGNVTTYSCDTDNSLKKDANPSAIESFYKSTDSGIKVRKFDDPDQKQNCFRDIVLIDLSEIYLVRAEACLLAGNTTGFWSDIDAVRNRAKAPALNNSLANYDPQYSLSGEMRMLDLLLDERARECYAQKIRFVDLRRTKQLVRYNIAFNPEIASVADMTGLDGNIMWLRPIPDAELNNNTSSGMTQNPGYVVAAEEEETAE